jgi:hypothetical protein
LAELYAQLEEVLLQVLLLLGQVELFFMVQDTLAVLEEQELIRVPSVQKWVAVAALVGIQA